MTRIVNKRELSEILGTSERTLTDWQKEGMPVQYSGERGENNQYSTEHVISWMVAREVFKTSKETAKDRLARLQADRVQIDLDEKRGLLIPADKIEPVWTAMVIAAKNFMRAEVPRLAQLLETTEGVDSKRDLLTETHDEFLRKLSRFDPGDDFDADPDADASGGQEVRASTENDGGSVGGALSVPLVGDE